MGADMSKMQGGLACDVARTSVSQWLTHTVRSLGLRRARLSHPLSEQLSSLYESSNLFQVSCSVDLGY